MEKKIENSHLVAADATETRDIFDSITIHSQLLEKYIRLSQTHALDFNGQGTPATTAPTNNITELPHEIIQTIVLECDLMTLLMVRCSGPQLTKLVDSIPEFKKVCEFVLCLNTHSPNVAYPVSNDCSSYQLGHCDWQRVAHYPYAAIQDSLPADLPWLWKVRPIHRC